MSFQDWIYSRYPNPRENHQWGALHIATLVVCILAIVFLALFLRKKEKGKTVTLYVLTGTILFFELLRRILNATRPLLYGGEVGDWLAWTRLIVPRPWCAISCWLLIVSAIVKKKFFFNLASMSALICAIIFFIAPEAGFNNQYMLFENVYSIGTHALLLVTSITLITLGFADFRYIRGKKWTDTALLELIGIAAIFLYAAIEIILGVEGDPLYFMPGNDVMDILGLSHPLYVVLYAAFLALYFNLFYLIPQAVSAIKKKKKA